MGLTDQKALEQKYTLKCTLTKKEIGFEDTGKGAKKYNAVSDIFILIPHESTQKTKFLKAWLGGGVLNAELLAHVKNPFNVTARFLVSSPNKNCPTFHLQLMSTEPESMFENLLKETSLASIIIETIESSRELHEEFSEY